MNKLVQLFQKYASKKICILGFGREGKSTLDFLSRLPAIDICIADKNAQPIESAATSKHPVTFQTGADYLAHLSDFDLIIKSPGVLLPEQCEQSLGHRLTSQTALFLDAYHDQIVGITGTKGKSTTSRLIHHLLQSAGHETVIAGNIGIPPFSILDSIGEKTRIVYELSAHQLKKIAHAPHISLLLNIFPEHLDYFGTLDHYAEAKLHIGSFQNAGDIFLVNTENDYIQQFMKNQSFSGTVIPITQNGSEQIAIHDHSLCWNNEISLSENDWQLKGKHNLLNAVFAIEAAHCCGVDYQKSMAALPSFRPLEHRLEYVGCFKGKHFYNDSIATVPEAALAAIEAVGKVDTLILGGMDRGIDYSKLLDFLLQGRIGHLAFTGFAGERMLRTMQEKVSPLPFESFFSNDWEELLHYAVNATPEKGTCLLSPAAASYGQFRDFEERGRFFKRGVQEEEGKGSNGG